MLLAVVSCGWAVALAQDAAVKAGLGQPLEATTYQIRNKKYQELLRPKDANNADGTRIVLYSPEPWKCMTWKVQPTTNEDCLLRNFFTHKTFSPEKADKVGADPVVQIPFAHQTKDVPVWQFTKLADGTYKITDAQSTNVLTAVPGADGYGEEIVVEPWRNLDEQKWELMKIDPQHLTM